MYLSLFFSILSEHAFFQRHALTWTIQNGRKTTIRTPRSNVESINLIWSWWRLLGLVERAGKTSRTNEQIFFKGNGAETYEVNKQRETSVGGRLVCRKKPPADPTARITGTCKRGGWGAYIKTDTTQRKRKLRCTPNQHGASRSRDVTCASRRGASALVDFEQVLRGNVI